MGKRLLLASVLCLSLLSPKSSALDLFYSLLPPQHPETCLRDCKLDSLGFTLIKSFEGYSPFIYKDSAGVPTIGFGHAILSGERFTPPLIGKQATDLLYSDISARTKQLNEIIIVPLRSNQFDALTSFAYNVGVRTFQKSSLLKYVNSGRTDVHDIFLLYDHAGGKVIRGLQNRRQEEAELFDKTD